jgi:hypothetical protein
MSLPDIERAVTEATSGADERYIAELLRELHDMRGRACRAEIALELLRRVLDMSGATGAEIVKAVQELRAELSATIEDRAGIEQQRRQLVIEARRYE